jgi:hypothetical protein
VSTAAKKPQIVGYVYEITYVDFGCREHTAQVLAMRLEEAILAFRGIDVAHQNYVITDVNRGTEVLTAYQGGKL